MDGLRRLLAIAVMAIAVPAVAAGPTPFTVADLTRIEELSAPVFAPDGASLAYVVTRKGKGDENQSDIWTVPSSGGAATRLTRTDTASEWNPQYSRDGRVLGFLSDRAAKDETQLWTMARGGSQARQISHVEGGVSDYSIAPDGRAAVVVAEVDPAAKGKPKANAPIVIDRFRFKDDERGYIRQHRQQLIRIDFASGKATPLTDGNFDHWLPSWSPDGRSIAFASARCADADRHICSDVYVMPATGGAMRKISTNAGADMEPDWAAGRPEWSPDSRYLVWLQADDEKLTWYAPFQIAVADLATGEVSHPARQDRWVYHPRWSADGASLLALIEHDRDTWLARIDPASGATTYLTNGSRFALDFAVGPGARIVVLDGSSDAPPALRTVAPNPVLLTHHNGFVGDRIMAATRDVSFRSGDVEIHAQLVLPPGYRPGTKLPVIVRLHGGPVYQFSHEFMADWQVYAAHGYAVLAPNPRGSSGRGAAFAQAQMAAWGQADVADISAAIDHVIASGIADPARIGVGGWSYGGILTNYMIARDPRIRAAVSGAGMANFFGGYGTDQYVRDYEIELGTPWDKPDLWRKLSYPFFEARRITAPTLYLCAAKDNNVPCSGAEQMYQALRSTGVPTQLVIYPDEHHGLTIPSHIEDRLQRHLDWYDRYLMPAKPKP